MGGFNRVASAHRFNLNRYRLFATNMVLSLRLAGVENMLVVALDEEAYAFFMKHRVPTFFDPNFAANSTAHHHQSESFKSIMEIRLHYILQVLRMGIAILFTDVDAVFKSNPFPALRSGKQVRTDPKLRIFFLHKKY